MVQDRHGCSWYPIPGNVEGRHYAATPSGDPNCMHFGQRLTLAEIQALTPHRYISGGVA